MTDEQSMKLQVGIDETATGLGAAVLEYTLIQHQTDNP
jgi:hypothetical protein